MGKYIRLGLGVLAGVVVGFVVYEVVKKRREKKKLVMPEVKKGELIKFPSQRPPYAEAAESTGE